TPKPRWAVRGVRGERRAPGGGVPGGVEEPFCVLATMNPLDHQGTYALPAAQVDRFMMMLEIGYPTPDDESRVLDTHLAATSPLAALQPVITRASFLDWRDTVPQ